MNGSDVLLWRPRLRDSLVVEHDEEELLFISTSDRRVKRFSASETVHRLIPLLDGTRTVTDVVGHLCHDSEELTHEVCGALALLRDEKLLSKVPSPVEGKTELSRAQVVHHDRQIRLFQELCDAGFVDYDEGLTAQERLAAATVVVCGVGGLGTVVASSLAASGVGKLIVCDDDVVDESNLTRQLMYSLDDVGQPKTAALARRLARINPHTNVSPKKRKVESAADIADLIPKADLVISCADQPSITEMATILTEACWPGTPHLIGGSYSYHTGALGLLVIPGTTACWHCLRTEVAYEHGRDRTVPLVPKSRYVGVLGAQSGIIGNMMAWEAVRFLMGMGSALSNRWIEFDYRSMSCAEITISRRPDCWWCNAT